MAEVKTVSVVPLNGSNYPTWKVQCRMALMKDGLWTIVDGTEAPPPEQEADKYRKFVGRRDRALALIVLSIEPSLLYLVGDPENPVTVWQKLADQFQKKTWANKLELRRKLYAMRLKEGESVQNHVKVMTEIFEALAVIGDPVSEEDRVVHLLASLPESFNMLVTALEANPEVPKMENVTERLLHEERKMIGREADEGEQSKAMTAHNSFGQKKKFTCHYCGRPGHLKRNCRKLAFELANFNAEKKEKPGFKAKGKMKHKANSATSGHKNDSNSSSDDDDALVVCHALSAGSKGNWIVDSGATCHMCNDEKLFESFEHLHKPQEVTLGDGNALEATGQGNVSLEMRLSAGKTKRCVLRNVLYVPKLAYNLLSVTKASEAGKVVKFDNVGCQIVNKYNKTIAVATKVGSLYYLEYNELKKNQQLNVIEKESKERLWHRRYGHLGEQNLKKLAGKRLVHSFDYDVSKEIGFCEACIGGKHHRSKFQSTGGTCSKEPLELVHSDVCGKMNAKSLGGAEYFLTFIDDKTRYVWVYPLKHKSEVFDHFLEWKALVENASGHKLKVLRTDNGGEFTSTKFEEFLKSTGVRHECTVPKTPEQNGVAERLNRTLVEKVRSMLIDSKLPHKFWAEALSTATYLRNRSPTKVIAGMTPHEAWAKEKPQVGHLRVFGCDAYAHIPKDERQKLDPKMRKCIFLGYGQQTKGYRLYDPDRGKIFYSRDVKFNESEKEKENEANNDPVYHVDLDFSHNGENMTDSDKCTTEQPSIECETEVVPRRSERLRHPPDFYGTRVNVTSQNPKEPKSIEEAVSGPEKSKWEKAMEVEMQSLEENSVWDLVELPEGKRAIGNKWVYKVKTGADGLIERYKARLVAQGFSQKYGDDYDETFCPVVRLESLRVLIALAVQYGLKLHQVDVTTAFLNGELEEEVYMRQPEGFITQGKEHMVCKLNKSIYGLKQSPRCWNTALDNQLKQMGFIQSVSDPCIYTDAGGDKFFIGVYVDDIILAGHSDKRIQEVKDALAMQFDIKDIGNLHYFLGIKVLQDDKSKSIWIGQPLYINNLLKKFGMQDCKAVGTPVDVSTKLVKATNNDEIVDQQLYQSAIGSLLYLSVSTRPDITYAVSTLARFSSEPTKQHWTAAKRVMRYLKGTINHGIHYSKKGSQECICYSDADWAGDIDDRRSTSGYLFQISGGAVTWSSKKQSCVALSTAEAEYIALASTAQEAVWMRQLTTELGNSPETATVIYEDNQSAISMTKNPQYHGKAKHIAIKYHFIREQVSNGTVNLQYCPTEEMVADMFTKGLSRERFCKLRDMAGVTQLPDKYV